MARPQSGHLWALVHAERAARCRGRAKAQPANRTPSTMCAQRQLGLTAAMNHRGASSVRKGLTVVLAQWDVGCRVAGLPAVAGPAGLPR
jgi:hypothetical protein